MTAITVAQIKILYSSSGRVGDHFESVVCVGGNREAQASKQAYINKNISTTSSVHNEALHNIKNGEPKPEKSYELLGRVRALWPVPDRTTWGLFLSLRVCPDLSVSSWTMCYRAKAELTPKKPLLLPLPPTWTHSNLHRSSPPYRITSVHLT